MEKPVVVGRQEMVTPHRWSNFIIPTLLGLGVGECCSTPSNKAQGC
jgi:hypothetical protein